MVLKLLLPESVDEVAFKIIWCVLEKGCVSSFLSDFRVALSECVEALLFLGFDDKWVDVYWSAVLVSCQFSPCVNNKRTFSYLGPVTPW
jgi:hypothetical protein